MPEPAPAPSPPLIELDRASVLRGARLALDDVSLRIPFGRHTAILGPNGCGKSTFIKLITRELYPLARDDGRPAVRILGRHLWDVRRIRSQLGIVTAALHDDLRNGLPGLSAADVVLGAFQARLARPGPDAAPPAMRERANAALERADAAHLAAREYATLSTGEARRVLVARALVHAPRALLLDEPTTGLDLVARQRVLDILRALAREGVTLVLVTHHFEELLPEFGHVLLMRDGRVLADAARARALTVERLSATFGAPLHWDGRPGSAPRVAGAVDRSRA